MNSWLNICLTSTVTSQHPNQFEFIELCAPKRALKILFFTGLTDDTIFFWEASTVNKTAFVYIETNPPLFGVELPQVATITRRKAGSYLPAILFIKLFRHPESAPAGFDCVVEPDHVTFRQREAICCWNSLSFTSLRKIITKAVLQHF